ncbi:hypothetical protein U1Q18_023881 [Sarracenia purpurea var. burkii]
MWGMGGGVGDGAVGCLLLGCGCGPVGYTVGLGVAVLIHASQGLLCVLSNAYSRFDVLLGGVGSCLAVKGCGGWGLRWVLGVPIHAWEVLLQACARTAMLIHAAAIHTTKFAGLSGLGGNSWWLSTFRVTALMAVLIHPVKLLVYLVAVKWRPGPYIAILFLAADS